MSDSKLQQAYLQLFREFEANEGGVLVDDMQANPLFDVAERTLLKLADSRLRPTDQLLAVHEWRDAVRQAADLYATRRMECRASELEEGERVRAAEIRRGY